MSRILLLAALGVAGAQIQAAGRPLELQKMFGEDKADQVRQASSKQVPLATGEPGSTQGMPGLWFAGVPIR